MKESNKLDQRLIDKIIRVAYGDAGIFVWLHVLFKSLKNKERKSLLEDYRQTANVVHKLKQEEVPEHITEGVKSYAGDFNKKGSILSNFQYGVYSFFSKKTILATVFGILIVFAISVFLFRGPTPAHKYSKAEIELAQKQLQKSFAIVGSAFQKAERSFSDEILKNQINKNLNRGYYLVNNILIGG